MTTHDKNHQCATCLLKRKLRSKTSLTVILAGLVVGLLFVDVAQLFSQRGLSARAQKEASVVAYDGATWVKYNAPKIRVDVITEKPCPSPQCSELQLLLKKLRKEVPTIDVRQVDISTELGNSYARSQNIKILPSLIVHSEIVTSDFFHETKEIFIPHSDTTYLLNTALFDLSQHQLFDAENFSDTLSPTEDGEDRSELMIFNPFCEECRENASRILQVDSEKNQQPLPLIEGNHNNESQALYCVAREDTTLFASLLVNQNFWVLSKDVTLLDELETAITKRIVTTRTAIAECRENREVERAIADVTKIFDAHTYVLPTHLTEDSLVSFSVAENE